MEEEKEMTKCGQCEAEQTTDCDKKLCVVAKVSPLFGVLRTEQNRQVIMVRVGWKLWRRTLNGLIMDCTNVFKNVLSNRKYSHMKKL